MASRLQDVILRGLAAARPLATATAPGTLYYSTDTAVTERSDGTTWQTYADGGGGGGGVPLAHAASHSSGGTDPVTVTNLAGYPGGTTTFLRADHTFATPTSTPIAHATTHQPGGTDPMAVDAVAAMGSLRTLGTTSTSACAGNDARLSDARTPTTHAASHSSGSSDPVTVTNLAGYPGGTTNFLRADGTFAAPAGGGGITALTTDVTASGSGSVVATIANDAVTYAKMQNISAASLLLGRGSAGGSGDTQEITLGTNLSMSGTTLNGTTPSRTSVIGITVDGGGAVITTGLKGYLEVPFACTIQAATLLADVAGAVVFDVWKQTYASFPPVVGNTITASAKPTITATNQKSQDATLSGWTTTVNAGDILAFNVDSVTTIKRVTLTLKISV